MSIEIHTLKIKKYRGQGKFCGSCAHLLDEKLKGWKCLKFGGRTFRDEKRLLHVYCDDWKKGERGHA